MRRTLCILAFICLYQSVLAQHPELINSGEVLQKAADLSSEKKYEDAIALYKTVSPSDTNYSSILHELSFALYLDSSYTASVDYAKLGLTMFPEKTGDWYILIANAFDAEGKYNDAISYYDSALKLNAYNYYSWFNKGLAFYNLDKKDEAIACFQRAVLINPYHSSSHFYLGVMYTEQGKLPQAMLCFITNLLISPDNRYMSRSVNYLNAIAKVTDEINGYASNAAGSNDDNFEFQQEILLSKAALDSKYKLLTDVEDPITRQMQVLMEKLKYNAADKGFCMQYYVPFYAGVFSRGEFNVLVNYIFSGLDIKSVTNFNNKNKKAIDPLKDSAINYLNIIRRTELTDYTARTKADYKFYYGENGLSGIGKWTNNGTEDMLVGPWEFYFDNGQTKSKGMFNANGEKEGDWVFHYNNGALSEKSSFKNGKVNGKLTAWFDNGNMSQESFYKLDSLDGEKKTYFFNALPKAVENYKRNLLQGKASAYTYNGFLNYTANYKDDELDGELTFYYKNGKPQTVKTYTNGKLNGAYKHYSETGVLDNEGNYVDDKPAGAWKEYYDSKAVKAEYSYVNGAIEGVYKEYYENGKTSQLMPYTAGKINGKEEDFDEDGIKYCEATYEKGKLKELVFFDKSGKIISSSTTRKGAGNLVFYDADANKSREGYFNKDGDADGHYAYYFKSGKIKTELEYKGGLRNGERKIYYANGVVSEKINFSDDEENGLLLSYHTNGALSYAGNFVDGEKQGEHQSFDVFNTMLSSYNYLNDELDGFTTYYTPNGKKTYEENYRTGWLVKATQFDSTGNILSESNFPAGKGMLVYKHLNGKDLVRVSYQNYLMQGKYESFYFDGSPMVISFYKNGVEDSTYKFFNYGGKLSQEGKYVLGKREGLWKFYDENEKPYYTQQFVNGELTGATFLYNDDGTKDKEIHYKENVQEGPFIIYGTNNEVAAKLNFHQGELISYTYDGKDGKLVEPVIVKNGTALVTAYYKNGNKSVEINYDESMENGVRKIFYNNGKPYIDGTSVYDQENGPKKIYFADGKIAKEQTYLYGNLHGIVKEYHANGSLKSEVNYYNGQENGTAKYYDETGKLKETRNYYYGALLSVTKP